MDLPSGFGPSTSLDDELTCSICLEIFSNPVSLPCLHNFCYNCLRKVPTNRRQNANHLEIRCPQCRNPVQLRNGSVDALPKNTTIANIIEKEKRRRSYCESTMCCIHRKEYGLACIDCSALICAECFYPDHKSHNVRSIKQANDLFLADLKDTMLPRLMQRQASLDKKYKKWTEADRKMTKSLQDQCTEISRMFKCIRTELVMKENKIIADFQSKHNGKIETLQRHLKEAKDELEELNELIAKARNLSVTDPFEAVQGCMQLKIRMSCHPLPFIDNAEEEAENIPKAYACSNKVEQVLEILQTEIRSISLESCMEQNESVSPRKRQRGYTYTRGKADITVMPEIVHPGPSKSASCTYPDRNSKWNEVDSGIQRVGAYNEVKIHFLPKPTTAGVLNQNDIFN